jgi:hypothetical protein
MFDNALKLANALHDHCNLTAVDSSTYPRIMFLAVVIRAACKDIMWTLLTANSGNNQARAVSGNSK